MAAKPIPDGYHSVTPYLVVKGAARALEFYGKAFGAEEIMRFDEPGGKIGHAEIRIGNSVVMLADEHPEMGCLGPARPGAAGVSMLVYVEDVDTRFAQAVKAGAKAQRPVQDQFYGDRCGTLEDPFGHVWTLATHKEDVSKDEIRRRMESMHA
ncbi:MAG: VOC family protein [Burkholderiaceae bacterium]|nr:MAG: VOC family protein [Burkholderiaceae bacterium]